MINDGGFFVDIDEISKFLLVNWGFRPFRNIIFPIYNSIVNFEFWFSIFHEQFVIQT